MARFLSTCCAVLAVAAASLVASGHSGAQAFELGQARPAGVATAAVRPSASPALVARVTRSLPIRRWPGAGRVLGSMPATSRYFHQRIAAWVLRVARGGRFGRVRVPYTGGRLLGWIDLRGLALSRTGVRVDADLSAHTLVVRQRGRIVLRAPAATGAPSSPTPPGRYFVTDRVAFRSGSPYGTFAFGISGIQTHLPRGWSGGDQLAIHGTNDPGSIGTSSSAGCLRVSERVLQRLERLLWRGTPVVIRP